MADKSIGELPVSQGMTDDALSVVYQNSETVSIEGRQIKQYAKDSVKDYVDGAAKSAKDAAGSATEAKKSESASKENADKTAADVLVVKSAADAERERVTAEELRRTAETSRETEEGKRETSEEERKTSETTRHKAEEGRVTSETERVDNETTRGRAEEQRATEEGKRAAGEQGRNTAEGLRDTEENKRSTAEAKRATEEKKRAEAESARDTEEGKRATSETGRETAERGRETAETDRVEAENLRMAANAALSVWGPYDPTKTYKPLNKVAYNGSSYICTAACTGKLPTDTAYWLMIAAKGLDGEGAGDMMASTYDPDGKAENVYGYADKSIAKHVLTANRNVYVSNDGNDETGDGTMANPWATIQKAVDEGPEETGAFIYGIYLRGGTYAGFKLDGKCAQLNKQSGDVVITSLITITNGAHINMTFPFTASPPSPQTGFTVSRFAVANVGPINFNGCANGINIFDGGRLATGPGAELNINNCTAAGINVRSGGYAKVGNITGAGNNQNISVDGGIVSYTSYTASPGTNPDQAINGGIIANDLATNKVVEDAVQELKDKHVLTGGIPIVITYTPAGGVDGVDYAADVPGVTELYNGLRITLIPHIYGSTASEANLSINGGSKIPMRRRRSKSTIIATANAKANWINKNSFLLLSYDGLGRWLSDICEQPDSEDLYGPVLPANAGLGRDISTEPVGLYPVTNGAGPVELRTAEQVAADVAPFIPSGGKRVCRFTVGTSTAGWTAADCDYLCDGTDDQVEFNAAIQSLPATGGEVVILDGTYNLSDSIQLNKNITFSGNGSPTHLIGARYKEAIIVAGDYCHIEHVKVKAGYNRSAIKINNSDCVVNNCVIYYENSGMGETGISVNNVYRTKILSNTVSGFLAGSGISVGTVAYDTLVQGNHVYNCGTGIGASGKRTKALGNNCIDNDTGIVIGYYSELVEVSNNTIIRGDGTTSSYTDLQYTIRVVPENAGRTYCKNCLISNNIILGKNYVLEGGGMSITFANNKYN